MLEKLARHHRIRPPNWNYFNQREGETGDNSMPYVMGSVANQEVAAIRSKNGFAGRLTPSVANQEVAAIRSWAWPRRS